MSCGRPDCHIWEDHGHFDTTGEKHDPAKNVPLVTDDWPQIKARLEEATKFEVAWPSVRGADIRASLQRLELDGLAQDLCDKVDDVMRGVRLSGESLDECAARLRQRVEELEQGDPGLKLLFELQDSGVVQGCHSGLRPAVRELVERVEELEERIRRGWWDGATKVMAQRAERAEAEVARLRAIISPFEERMAAREAHWVAQVERLWEEVKLWQGRSTTSARDAAAYEAEVERLRTENIEWQDRCLKYQTETERMRSCLSQISLKPSAETAADLASEALRGGGK